MESRSILDREFVCFFFFASIIPAAVFHVRECLSNNRVDLHRGCNEMRGGHLKAGGVLKSNLVKWRKGIRDKRAGCDNDGNSTKQEGC